MSDEAIGATRVKTTYTEEHPRYMHLETLRMARAQVYATCLIAATIHSALKPGEALPLPELAAQFYTAAMKCTEQES